ncbi:MAG: CDP-alcohol phosphatidyltransferase family protein [Oligoflexia bacterium]|nr:CDP-alcohol phosphatidyltransferase family protein [Oligoflexia bacterium]
MALDLTNGILLAMTVVLAIAYTIRVVMKGRAHFERVEQQGSGLLLRRTLMEMGYWGMQPVAKLLVRLGVPAAAVTWTSLGFGAAAGLSLATGNFETGALLGAVSGILDAVDGMVARLTSSSSRSGKILDSTLDRYVEFFLFAGLIFHYRHSQVPQVLALGALIGSFMVSYSTALGEIFKVELRGGGMRRPERMLCLILGATFSTFSVPGLGPEKGSMLIALVLIAVIANVSAVQRFQGIRRILSAPARSVEPLPVKGQAAS